MNTIDEIKYRASLPTPPFFQKLKKVGLIIAAIGLAVLSAPGYVPEVLTQYAGYAITAGTILVSICQLTVDEVRLEEELMTPIK
ncbi:hypothetical protein DFQ04_1383 [Algoriphagus boseongensis]|uniref:Uncharacterized protein n=1 Tax=Algoriphagus boseongensis TaxID=1442587 RepID=A0A4R6T916_9BACT|nr:hypothetical protein [Algoriphagus boseongensis]TDQ19560.1 hypothetical protein DFQ04_1383 [Algoriphagus boseongensis]